MYIFSRQRELDVLRVLLQEHRGRYRTQLRLLDQPPSQQHAGAGDQMTMAAVTLRRLDEIERALQALEHGRYGVCSSCVIDIPIDHLVRHPAAKHCPACSRFRLPGTGKQGPYGPR
ncbi:TraR/DksA family transcriptional regulator [Dactylosporangium sp. CA-139066]|uniref:TraR/DksA family transcriptional regulator n=1 Tax=Dactylosporangium sp. CA-139066 TaxID=3239930 RepID=UPI003D913BE9